MNNIRFDILDLLSEEAFDMQTPVDLIIAGDIVYDSVLTESFCRVSVSYPLHVVVDICPDPI